MYKIADLRYSMLLSKKSLVTVLTCSDYFLFMLREILEYFYMLTVGLSVIVFTCSSIRVSSLGVNNYLLGLSIGLKKASLLGLILLDLI